MATTTPEKFTELHGAEAIARFRELVDDIHTVMLTSSTPSGMLDGRPMGVQQLDDTGVLWFFTGDDTAKVEEIQRNPGVALSYIDTRKATYVFARGSAVVLKDRAKAQELWSPLAKAWFDGPDDPNLSLLRVQVESAEYWNDPAGGLVSILRVGAKALGANVSEGEMGHLEP